MAITEEIILKVQKAVESANSVKELRTALADARKAMNEATIDSEEYKGALQAVNSAQDQLNNVTRVGKKEITEADTSYNALSATLTKLKKEYKAANDEVTRSEIAKKIAPINEKLKELDANVGVFGRNVGNYAQGVAQGFASIGGAASGMINPIKGVTTGFQVLSKTPVIAILGLLINIITAVINQMKKTEDGTKALSSVMGIFANVADIATKGLQLLGKGFAWVIEKTTDLLKKFKLLGDESNKRIGIEEKEIALAQEKRRVTMENADLELEISKKRAEASDKLNKSGAESIKLTKEAMELEKKRMENNLNLARQEYELIKEKNALLPSSSQELQAEADAYAAMQQAQQDYNNKIREYNSQLKEMSTRAKQESKEAAEEVVKAIAGGEDEDWVLAVEEDYYRVEAATKKHLENMKQAQAEAAAEQTRKEKEEAAKREKIAKAEETWQKNKYNYISSLASSASKIAGENTAVGKALAVASTTISTYQAAQQAYASQFLPTPTTSSPVRGALAAAAAVASGLANVKSILSVKTDGSTASMANVPNSAVQTYAPATVQQVAVTRSLTGASEEQRLNDIVSGVNKPVKAYVVSSEMEGQMLADKQAQAESSF